MTFSCFLKEKVPFFFVRTLKLKLEEVIYFFILSLQPRKSLINISKGATTLEFQEFYFKLYLCLTFLLSECTFVSANLHDMQLSSKDLCFTPITTGIFPENLLLFILFYLNQSFLVYPGSK